jgi:hypothetical protein
MIIENSSFEEMGSDELIDSEIPRDVMREAFAADSSMDEYIRDYQERNILEFEDLVNMA